MNTKTKNYLQAAGIAAVGLGGIAAASYGVTKTMVRFAMDRKSPRLLEKQAARLADSKELSDITARMLDAESRLENSGAETVELLSRDGLKLIGHWKPCPNAKRIIVAMHGWRSGWARDFGIISEFWEKEQCSVLYAEQRAQGESEGEYITFGLLERYDCLDWINWVNAQNGENLPIYLGGVSMGASTILMTAGLELPKNVKGIVADCGFTSAHAIWNHVSSKQMHIPYRGLNSLFADRISQSRIRMSPREYSTVDAMKVCRVPVLFIHGTDDHFVPVEMTYENYKACAAEKQLLIVPGAEHGMSYIVNEPAYQDAVLQFWKKQES